MAENSKIERRDDPMEAFGKWLDRHETECPDDDRHAIELIRDWQNDEEGERLTLTLPMDELPEVRA